VFLFRSCHDLPQSAASVLSLAFGKKASVSIQALKRRTAEYPRNSSLVTDALSATVTALWGADTH